MLHASLFVVQVGCMGFCMGGALTFLAAQEGVVDAIAPFYGTPDPKLAKVPHPFVKSRS